MTGFRKAKAEQAALKLGIYGPPGSGKTFTSLLLAEGLAHIAGGRIAVVDTEHGSDFYCQAVPPRQVHPEAFDFDALYTQSITETLAAVRDAVRPDSGFNVIVLDSITHLWQACIASYRGRTTSVGTIPMQAWGAIKKPYKELMQALLNCRQHIIICGRQGTEYAKNEDTDELEAVGLKMKAEGETPYEPHILLRMEAVKAAKSSEVARYVAYVEKDRTGVLSGRSFVNPTYETICGPLLPLLGATQAQIASLDATAAIDAEQFAAAEAERVRASAELLKQFKARIDLAKTTKDLKAVGKAITPETKSRMTTADVAALREAYIAADGQVAPAQAPAEQVDHDA